MTRALRNAVGNAKTIGPLASVGGGTSNETRSSWARWYMPSERWARCGGLGGDGFTTDDACDGLRWGSCLCVTTYLNCPDDVEGCSDLTCISHGGLRNNA